MKRLYIIYTFVGLLLFACTPNKTEVIDQETDVSQVDLVVIKPNSHILYADNLSELNLSVEIYDIIENIKKEKVPSPDGGFISKDSLHIDTVRLQTSRLLDQLKFYKEDGTEIPEGKFKTSTVEDFKVYAKVGEMVAVCLSPPQ